ncbi:hypothetical protein AXF42_Ash009165 [Apostasia shenzhenica]|uniref:Nodulin-related protein 1 n=1 Tax=Apostasia shenzhenica TaxID=1088818 RepID=A0A2I0ADP9_9ASPA|nr:hypothetical protein AXF42_Ash009165 [Apostasia shenzhenica]
MASQQETTEPAAPAAAPAAAVAGDRGKQQPSHSDLLSSAKVLAGAAQSVFSHDGSRVDKAKVAVAGEDLLDAASHYGKLQEKGYGSYVEKAEGYLHRLQPSPEEPKKEGEAHSAPPNKEDDKQQPSEGLGGYFKMAQGFFNK